MSRVDFLVEKAQNFKVFLSNYSPAPEVALYMDGFNPAMVLPTVMSVVVPIVKAGKTESAVRDLMAKLTIPGEERAAVAAKIQRYLECFAEVATA